MGKERNTRDDSRNIKDLLEEDVEFQKSLDKDNKSEKSIIEDSEPEENIF